MPLVRLGHHLSKEKFVVDGSGSYWIDKKEVCDTENLPESDLKIKVIRDGMPCVTNLRLDYLKTAMYLDEKNADEILKNFKNEESESKLKRVIFDSCGINFVFKNKEVERCKEYCLRFINSRNDPLSFELVAAGQTFSFFRDEDCLILTDADKKILIFNSDYTVDLLD